MGEAGGTGRPVLDEWCWARNKIRTTQDGCVNLISSEVQMAAGARPGVVGGCRGLAECLPPQVICGSFFSISWFRQMIDISGKG
jgi:hypothetical protein